jgi:hypothetical protein
MLLEERLGPDRASFPPGAAWSGGRAAVSVLMVMTVISRVHRAIDEERVYQTSRHSVHV